MTCEDWQVPTGEHSSSRILRSSMVCKRPASCRILPSSMVCKRRLEFYLRDGRWVAHPPWSNGRGQTKKKSRQLVQGQFIVTQIVRLLS